MHCSAESGDLNANGDMTLDEDIVVSNGIVLTDEFGDGSVGSNDTARPRQSKLGC